MTRIVRIAVLLLAAVAALAACGYKGDLVMPEAQDEKAGQVEPEPLAEPPGDAG